MRKAINLEELKKIELDILIKFASYCDNNNLRYYLACGTLIGAVRYQGFIPWDDDIDVTMPRSDYEKFLQLSAGRIAEDIDVLTYQNKPNYIYPFAKAVNNKTILIEKDYGEKYSIGVYIDIFPVDGVPENLEKFTKNIKKINFYRKMIDFSIVPIKKGKMPGSVLVKVILFPICRVIGHHYFTESLDHLVKRYDFEEAQQVAQIVWADSFAAVSKEEYIKQVQLEFESEKFNVSSNYDECLTKIYGDYMKLPPVEERISHHNFKAYWK